MAAALHRHARRLAWLGGLCSGRGGACRCSAAPEQDLVAAAMWPVIGVAARALALNSGRRRYRRRR